MTSEAQQVRVALYDEATREVYNVQRAAPAPAVQLRDGMRIKIISMFTLRAVGSNRWRMDADHRSAPEDRIYSDEECHQRIADRSWIILPDAPTPPTPPAPIFRASLSPGDHFRYVDEPDTMVRIVARMRPTSMDRDLVGDVAQIPRFADEQDAVIVILRAADRAGAIRDELHRREIERREIERRSVQCEPSVARDGEFDL